MRRTALAALALLCTTLTAHAGEWRVQSVDTPARVSAIDTIDGQVRVNAGGLWYRIVLDETDAKLDFLDKPLKLKPPDGALPEGRVAVGQRDIARAWLSEPTARYDHDILGDKNAAGSLVIELRNGTRQIVRLKDDAVFEDLAPRLADLDRDGRDEIVVVKSSLKRGSSLAVIAERKGKYDIVAETPPLGAAQRWLNPAGIGDFKGDGKVAIALVRQPHVVGDLELWSWTGNDLRKIAGFADASNHVAGTRAIDMSASADFDGDGILDIALPSLDRSRLRLIAFAPRPREIASLALPAKAVTNIGLIAAGAKPPAIAVGLADGTLVVIRKN